MCQKWQPSIRIAPPYFDKPKYISTISKSILNSFAKHGEPDILLLSFHGAGGTDVREANRSRLGSQPRRGFRSTASIELLKRSPHNLRGADERFEPQEL